jgi:transcriptional regulator with XRE-family HTH domain
VEYFREQRGFTVAEMVRKICISRRQYERIEKSGKTSPATAGRLAKALGVTLECLKSQEPLSQEDTALDLVWVESSKYPLGGRLIGLTSGLQELEAWLPEVDKRLLAASQDGDCPKLIIQVDQSEIALGLHIPSCSPFDCWERERQRFRIRPAIKDNDGVTCTTINKGDVGWLEQRIRRMAGNHSDSLQVNGRDLPESVECSYAILVMTLFEKLFDYGPPEPNLQIVQTERDVIQSVTRAARGNRRDMGCESHSNEMYCE